MNVDRLFYGDDEPIRRFGLLSLHSDEEIASMFGLAAVEAELAPLLGPDWFAEDEE